MRPSARLTLAGALPAARVGFQKVLVANRGEIAVRIIRACRELGLASVAVYSERDREALHVRLADESVCIGPPAARRSYLNIPALLAAAEITGAEAIHPGYGFLAENADFAEILERSGLTFIGPRPEQMRLMGNKLTARAEMVRAGLPILPGSEVLPDLRSAQGAAREIGYPVILKASAGGGGRGMRIVPEYAQMEHLLSVARSEAAAAFGSDEVYLEKYLSSPRHIEFQVLGDGEGAVVHLGERECSVQRRHQKLIEESPSPAVSPEVRARLGEQASRAVARMGYRGAGTLEFLFDGEEGDFYFLEMNTRIQVEHPITELVTGVDLVQAQLRIAQGEKLWLRQEDITLRGHAIECRINAEDPVRMRPSPGLITGLFVPGGPGIRFDSAAYGGWRVPVEYDSLIAKLVAYGEDRPQCLARMERALQEMRVEGIQTNIALHRRVLAHPDLKSGNYDTKVLDRVVGSA